MKITTNPLPARGGLKAVKIIDWKKHEMKLIGDDRKTVVHCPSCYISIDWNTSWDEKKLIFYCSECGKYSFQGRVISDEEAGRLSAEGD
jgi:predicted RNA-binding Zn-ribbon protein involved in translation (DUF1610 family)